ncbi:MAG: F0F1 ATP synthase subunit A [Phycisphaeraceae bacterium]|nr:F0F1 ATP synthase subunit A [Phycisphaeraceae bacterium]
MLASIYTLAADNPVDHVVQHRFLNIGEWWVWTAHTGNLLLTLVIMLAAFPWLARQIATGNEGEGNKRYVTRNPAAGMLEVIYLYLRDNTVRPLLGERTERFMPFLATLFFFILVNNLLGLVPILDVVLLAMPEWKSNHMAPVGGTATQNLMITGALAAVSFVVINVAGVKELGVGGYLKHLTGGAPPYLWPLLVVIEVAGTFIKPVALAIRLFANMTAGHILVATLFMFTGMSLKAGLAVWAPVTVVSAISAVAIYFLELFVAFLQAFVFMFLTTVFIAQLSHHGEHDEHHADGHADAHPAH